VTSEKRVIEIPLPEGAAPAEDDLEVLRAAVQAIVALRWDAGRRWEAIQRQLEADGWTVRSGLKWCAEARRGEHHEQAPGTTRDEAFAELLQLTRLDGEIGCP